MRGKIKNKLILQGAPELSERRRVILSELKIIKMDLNLKDIPRSVYIRYILLNLPGLAAVILVLIIIRYWVVLPVWLSAGIIAFWIIKDVVLFPFVWRSYDSERPGQSRSMIGQRGVARERLAPSGYVQVLGELWRAEKMGEGPPIEAGQPVQIVKMEGLTLYVEKLDSAE